MVVFISFLDHSQTFLGVLITLNILCIFANKDDEDTFVASSDEDTKKDYKINENNFILRFIHQYKEKLRWQLVQLEGSIKKVKKDFKESDDFKVWHKILDTKNQYSEEIVKEANKLDVQYSMALAASNTTVTIGYMEMNEIEASNEVSRAPLFTFIFGLLFFMVDEICNRWQGDVYEPLMAFSVFVIGLSTLYWMVVWGAFLFRRNFTKLGLRPKSQFWDMTDACLNPLDGGVLKIVICAGIFYLGCRFIPLEAMADGKRFIVVLSLGLIPITIIGIIREVHCSVKGNYSFMHVVGHLFSFIVYGLIILICYYQLNMDNWNIPEFKNIENIRLGVVSFSLLNGLILPFIFPYWKLSNTCKREIRKLTKGKSDIEAMQQKFGMELGNLCKKLA